MRRKERKLAWSRSRLVKVNTALKRKLEPGPQKISSDPGYSKQPLWVGPFDHLWKTVLKDGDSWWDLTERRLEGGDGPWIINYWFIQINEPS